MNKLISQLQRLYFLPGQQWHSHKLNASGDPAYAAEGALTPAIVAKALAGEIGVALNLISSDSMVRAMIVSFERATDWERVASLYQAIQEELDLPAPALSVSGRKGYCLWFSLAEPLPVAQTQVFLDTLCRRYLSDLPVTRLECRPDTDQPGFREQAVMKLVPARHSVSGKWSAFIDPSLGSMFIDESGLEMAPILDRQANLLAGLESIKTEDFQRALNILQAPVESDANASLAPVERPIVLQSEVATQSGIDVGQRGSKLRLGNSYTDPKNFLLAVMNDSSASAGQRIKAAKALLPYWASMETKDA